MYSLFSESFSGEQVPKLEASVVAAAGTEEKSSYARVPSHDPDAWKKPSFMSKDKGKGKARAADEDPQSPRPGKKRRRSVQSTSPAVKRAKVTETDDIQREVKLLRGSSDESTPKQSDEPAAEKKIQPKDGHTAPLPFSQDTTETPSQSQRRSKGRLANFLVDFENVDLGKEIPVPTLDWKRDVQSVLLRTGRIRTLREEVERDGSVYINQE
ncbi:hypothetical protein BU15DRAFT_73285 [Melanogaster broomeanus]|nr:hypothetical protein BU15DRAFT_73285 [Melanogaster broomeanus]